MRPLPQELAARGGRLWGAPAHVGRGGGRGILPEDNGYNEHDIRGRPGLDVVGAPAELQVEVPVGLVKQPGTNVSADNELALAA
jgi:hypothetical protein